MCRRAQVGARVALSRGAPSTARVHTSCPFKRQWSYWPSTALPPQPATDHLKAIRPLLPCIMHQPGHVYSKRVPLARWRPLLPPPAKLHRRGPRPRPHLLRVPPSMSPRWAATSPPAPTPPPPPPPSPPLQPAIPPALQVPHADGPVLTPRRVHVVRGRKAHGVHGPVVPAVALQLGARVVAEQAHPPGDKEGGAGGGGAGVDSKGVGKQSVRVCVRASVRACVMHRVHAPAGPVTARPASLCATRRQACPSRPAPAPAAPTCPPRPRQIRGAPGSTWRTRRWRAAAGAP